MASPIAFPVQPPWTLSRYTLYESVRVCACCAWAAGTTAGSKRRAVSLHMVSSYLYAVWRERPGADCQRKIEMSYFGQTINAGQEAPFPSVDIVQNGARRQGFAFAAQQPRALDGSAPF